ncbi:PEP-CTERM sorting domain-containing protein [Kiritimatiellaeota bacterium B1221]|nr:PEP-CTERM sorting domain-containing protein [Kiritimatiellaeota bacterium B1221]
MIASPPHFKNRLVTLGFAGIFMICSNVQAAIVTSPGETVLFQDSFDHNDNSWSNMGTTNSSAKIESGVLTPYAPGTSEAVNSSMTFGTPINLANGDVSVYFTASIQDRYSQNRFGVNLTDGDGNPQAGFVIHPAGDSNGYFTYTNASGTNTNQWNSNINPTYIIHTGFLDYKLTISANGQDGGGKDIYTASFFRKGYNGATGDDYGLVYTMSQDMYFEGGMVDALNLYVRNSSVPVKFDEVVVTQIPEPGTGILIGLTGLSIAIMLRRRA